MKERAYSSFVMTTQQLEKPVGRIVFLGWLVLVVPVGCRLFFG